MRVRFRHKIVFATLRPIFKIYLRLKYNYKAKKFEGIKGPYFIISNHTSMLDPFFITLSFKVPIYFVASDDIFSIKFWSKWITYLVSPIAKTKGTSDIATVKEMIEVAKQGGSIGLFPSGNTTYSGCEEHIPSQLARLAKKLKLPILLYNTKGLYGVDPRWGNDLRKGPSLGEVVKVLEFEEYKDIDNEKLDEIILNSISTNAFRDNEYIYKSNKKAEYLERALFLCPDCHSYDSMVSHGNFITCKRCHYKLEYQEDLSFKKIHGNKNFLNVKEYYDYQLNYMLNIDINNINEHEAIIHDTNEILILNKRAKSKKKLIKKACVYLYKDRLIVKNYHKEKVFYLDDIKAFAVQGRNKILFYTENDLYQLKGQPRRSALKYVYFYYALKRHNEINSSNFMGI